MQDPEIQAACTELSIAYARHVDFGEFDKFVELFTEDGRLELGFVIEGKEAIRKSMTRRSPELRSRHVLTNISINVLSETEATGVTYLTLYRHIGPESLEDDPIELQGPAAVGHYTDRFSLTDQGWRIAERTLQFAFQNKSAFSS